MTPLEFCIHALRVNGGAPYDIETADLAEQELHALRDDRATIDAMTTLLGKARTERDEARPTIATQDAKIKDLESIIRRDMGEDYLSLQALYIRQMATVRAQDTAILAMRQGLQHLHGLLQIPAADWALEAKINEILLAAAPAVREAERRIGGDERSKVEDR